MMLLCLASRLRCCSLLKAESARAISANLELFVRPPAPGRAPPHCPVFVLFFFCTLCRFLFGELMVPHE